MDIEDYARREAEKRFPDTPLYAPVLIENHRKAHAEGITHLADQLLSDRAVEAGVDQLERNGFGTSDSEFRLALEAALAAITEEENE